MAKRVSSIYGNALFELAVEENKMDALSFIVRIYQLRNCSIIKYFLRKAGACPFYFDKHHSLLFLCDTFPYS